MSFSPDQFLERFALPLVAGGELHVGAAIDGDGLTALRAYCATASDVTLRVERAWQDVARLWWLYPVRTTVDGEALRLAVGLHNALFLSHPASRWYGIRDAALGRVVGFTADCLALGPPRTEDQLVARHALLHRLSQVERTDVEVSFWAGRRRFIGCEPPARLMRWARLRGVSERRMQVSWLASDLTEAQRGLTETIFWQSPLTALLTPERPAPPFALAPFIPYLAHVGVCRLVCQRFLEIGLTTVGSLLATEFWRLVEDREGGAGALTPQQAEWLADAYRLWVGADGRPQGASAASTSVAQRSWPTLRLVARLVQYLYVASCMLDVPAVNEDRKGEGWEEPRTRAESVLVAAAACGLLARAPATGGGPVLERFERVLEQSRAALGPAGPELSQMLEQALAR